MPTANRINWSATGVPGGIPLRTIISASLNPGASAAQIQSALNNCPNGQVVFLNAGTYSLSSALRITNNGVTLRGAVDANSVPTTVLNFASGAGDWALIDISNSGYPANNWANVSSRNALSGLSAGSTSVTLNSAPTGLQVNQMLTFDQISDENLVWDYGSEGGPGGSDVGRNGNRTLVQVVRVTSISVNTVNFSPAIFSSFWKASQSPQAYWSGSGTSQVVYQSGMENLKVNRTIGGGGTNNLSMGPADSCWIKNVYSTQCKAAHAKLGFTINCEVRDSYFKLMDSVGSAAYCVWIIDSSSAKVENNIMYNSPCALGLQCVSGSAVDYNYGTLFPYTQSDWLPECVMTHGGHCDHNLFEGNFVPSFWMDWIHGNASFNSYVRNRVTGWESGKTDSTRCINIQENQWNLAILGNVLGTAGYHNTYLDTTGHNYFSIFNLIPYHSAESLLIAGNYNTVNSAVPASESLGAKTVALSYMYTSKPAWFGNLPWPAVDPLNPQAAVAGNLPAGYRYQFGRTPGS